MNYFPEILKWNLPANALDYSREEMARDGILGNEGISLWLGTRDNGEAFVTHLVFLRGAGVRKSPYNIQVSPELMNEVHDRAIERDVVLVGQIHSHDRDFGVGLSMTDHRFGIRVPYFLSVVYPDFAQRVADISECGIHVFLPDEGFMRLTAQEITHTINVDPTLRAETLIVGEP